MKINRLLAVAVLAFGFMQSFPTSALAGRQIEIDQGDNYLGDGQKWDFPGAYFKDGSSTIGTGIVAVPFALNIGSGAQNYSFQLDNQGRVILLDTGGQPTTNFIAPLFSNGTTFVPDGDFGGFIAFGAGQIDPQVLLPGYPQPGATYVPANALNVYRFLWNRVCANSCIGDGTDDISMEAVLIDRGAGDFDLDFFYSNPQGPVPTGATGGFLLGLNSATFSSFDAPGPDFCFRAGALSDTCSGTTAVPEPSSVLLILVGLGLLFAAARRNRKDTTALAFAMR